MTKRIINLAFTFIAISVLWKVLLISINHLQNCEHSIIYSSCKNDIHGFISACIIILIIIISTMIILYLIGEYDDFINKNIEPKLKKFYKFLNRRNEKQNT